MAENETRSNDEVRERLRSALQQVAQDLAVRPQGEAAATAQSTRRLVEELLKRLDPEGEALESRAPESGAVVAAVAEALEQSGDNPDEGAVLELLEGEIERIEAQMQGAETARLWDERHLLARSLRTLFEAASDPMLIVEPRRGRVRAANPAACRLFGSTATHLDGLPLGDLIPDLSGENLRRFVAEVTSQGSASRTASTAVSGQELAAALEVRGFLTSHEGETAILCLLAIPQQATCDGMAALQELAAELQSQVAERLLEIERLKVFFENVISALPLRAVVLSPQLTVLHANSAFCVQLGLVREDVVGRPISELLPAELLEVDGLRSALLSVLETGERVRWPNHRFADGEQGERVLSIRVDPCEGPDGERAVLLTLEDTTEQQVQVYQRAVLQELARALLGELDLPRLLYAILTGMTAGGAAGLGFNRAFLLLVDEEAGVLRARMAVGPRTMEEAVAVWREIGQEHRTLSDFLAEYDEQRLEESQNLGDIVAKLVFPLDNVDYLPMAAIVARETVHVLDAPNDPRVSPELWQALESEEFVVAPLVAREKVIGAAIADNRFSQTPIDQSAVQMLTALADMAALAIDTATTFRRAKADAENLDLALRSLRAAEDDKLRSATLAAIGEIAAIVAHEIRGPLAAIGGFARSIAREPERFERNARNAQIIVDEVARLEGILGGLLSFTKPSEPEFTMVDLGPLIESIAEQARQPEEHAEVNITVDLAPDVPAVRADAKQVRQIILNLVNNAIQAMPHGGHLTLALRHQPPHVEVLVRDTGEGIPPDRLERIFDAFFTSKPTGTGLGLALCKKLATQHGADIRVESEPGKGTTFTVIFPVPQEAASGSEAPV